MAEQYYTIPENPQYNENIPKIFNSTPVNAEHVVNPLLERLIENIAAVMILATRAEELATDANENYEAFAAQGADGITLPSGQTLAQALTAVSSTLDNLETNKADIDPGTNKLLASLLPAIDLVAGVTGTLSPEKGGTGKTSLTDALYAMINGLSVLSASGLATGDYLPLLDASAGTGKKVTLANLASYLQSSQGMAKIATGSYVGTGTYGANNPCTLTFPFVPKLLVIFSAANTDGVPTSDRQVNDRNGNTLAIPAVALPFVLTESYTYQSLFGDLNSYAKRSSDGKTVYWYQSSSADVQLNNSNWVYCYLAIG